MEVPSTGRAKINESINEFSIEVPTKRNWFVIVFLTAWLGGWVMGEFFALAALSSFLGAGTDDFGSYFILFWLIMWTVGGFFAIRTWMWMVFGREIISFTTNELTVSKKGALFFTPKVYNLFEVKNFEINPMSNADSIFGMQGNRDVWNLGNNGIFKFDYGLKTIKIANGLDEAEARFILEKIKTKHLLKG